MSPDLRARFVARMQVHDLIREFFRRNGFLEVQTPALVRAPGQEPYLEPFETVVRDIRGSETHGYLITSPEYALKKLLVAGFPKIFEIARCYRNNEPTGGLHNPEFTMLEWYRAGTDYRGIMEDTEQLVSNIASRISTPYPRLPTTFFAPPWERLSVADAFKKYADTDLDSVKDDTTFFKIFLSKIEPNLGREKPTFLYDYPVRMAALARAKPSDPRYAERFEVYVNGLELGNAYSELQDPSEHRRRFAEEQATRRAEGKIVNPIDDDFLAALESGLPACGGISIGVDRLAMVLLDAKSIDEVLFFPFPNS